MEIHHPCPAERKESKLIGTQNTLKPMMHLAYNPPALIIHHSENNRASYGKPYFYECEGRILNLAAATQFYIDHIPLTSLYWPSVKIAGNSYHLSTSMSTQEEAMKFLKDLTEKIESGASVNKTP